MCASMPQWRGVECSPWGPHWNAVLGGPILFCEGQPLTTASKDHHPPTANRHQPPTAANGHPLFNTAHVLTMKQRVFP